MPLDEEELARVRKEFDRRDSDARLSRLYAPDNAVARFLAESRATATRAVLGEAGFSDLSEKKILDVGCGGGAELQRIVDEGAETTNLVGIDLSVGRVAAARTRLPEAGFVVGNAARMPFGDARFDMAMCLTVLSSILNGRVQQAVALEIARVLRPGGILLWYDFMWNPRNPQTRGVGPRLVRGLFPAWRHFGRRVTLAPLIARAIVPRSVRLARLLETVPLLRSHYLGVAVKPGV